MSDDLGPALVRWAVRLAVACYAARVLMDAAALGSQRLRCAVWTAGFAFYLAHVAAAFQVVHRWSHADAVRATARQTAAVVGLDWGGGVWVNYAFTLLWAADVVAWHAVGPDYPCRFRKTHRTVQATFAFLVFNATAVFGPAFWRPVATAFALAVAAAWVWRARKV